MKKKIHVPVRMGVFNDIFWKLAVHFPGTPRGYANLALILFAGAMYMPFISNGGEASLQGWQWLKTGSSVIKYTGLTHKVLFISWLSTFYLIFSMAFLGDNRANAKPELFLILLGLAMGSIYIYTSIPSNLEATPEPAQAMTGIYLWGGSFFCGFMAHTKLAY